jgi:hypothetical protein
VSGLLRALIVEGSEQDARLVTRALRRGYDEIGRCLRRVAAAVP